MGNAFEQAVSAHKEWKTAFERAVRSGGSDLKVEVVRADNRCLLGMWLYGDGQQAIANPTASHMLRDIHAEFHAAAANVLLLAVAGRIHEAVAALSDDSPYLQWSTLLVAALERYEYSLDAPQPLTEA